MGRSRSSERGQGEEAGILGQPPPPVATMGCEAQRVCSQEV